MNEFHKLKWDSSFFCFNIARLEGNGIDNVELDSIIQTAGRQKIKLIYWFVNPIDSISVETASKYGLKLQDNKILLKYLINENFLFLKNDNIISYLGHPVTSALRRLSVQSGRYSRFRNDRNFAKGSFYNLYYKWLENSLAGILSSEVLVFTENSTEKGFITLKDEVNITSIGLIAVDQKSRGIGIGKKLLMSAFARSSEMGIKEISVTTQAANKEAMGFYQKLGFTIIQSTYIYHIWIK